MAVAARAALACPCDGMVRVGALAALALAEFGRHNLAEVQDAVTEAGALFDALDDEEVRAPPLRASRAGSAGPRSAASATRTRSATSSAAT